ncbi:MAG: hypothetical protein HYU71_03875 [Bacteroidetes bacterium]|nr:hypothetical protein [Bacteroidota bacterium]
MEITIGQIFDVRKKVLFPKRTGDALYMLCKEREEGIKHDFDICLKAFNSQLINFKKNEEKLSKWQKEKCKICAGNLGRYLEYLAIELDKKIIEEHCRLIAGASGPIMPFMPDIVLLLINSYQGAIETDLHWIGDLVLNDYIDISIGDFDYSKLEKYFPGRIEKIESLCRELAYIGYVSLRADSIKEAITCHNTKQQKASNLLLITIIEGLVRSLGLYLAGKQSLIQDTTDKRKYASLDGFLHKIPWKKDLSITDIKLGLLTGNYSAYDYPKENNVKTNLAERLSFLTRRFKDTRNAILHGEDTGYANVLNSFMNFSALYEVLLTIKEYDQLYPSQKR